MSDVSHEGTAIRRVSVLITSHNGASTIGDTLRALRNQHLPHDVCMSVVVVDDRSSDGTAERARALGDELGLTLHIERISTVGPTYCTTRQAAIDRALDRAIESSDAPFLLLLDDDAVPTPTWVATMLTFLAQHDVVSSPLRFVASEPTLHVRAIAALQSADAAFYALVARLVARSGRASGICFGAAGIRRALLDRTGNVASLGFTLTEDLAFARRAHAVGASIGFARGASVSVRSARSFAALRRRALRVSASGGPSALALGLALPVATLPLALILASVGLVPWSLFVGRWIIGSVLLVAAMRRNQALNAWPAAFVYEWLACFMSFVITADAVRHRTVQWGGVSYSRQRSANSPLS